MAHLERKVIPVAQVPQDRRVLKDHPDHKARKVDLVQPDLMEALVSRVLGECRGLPGRQVAQAQLDPKAV